LQQKGKAYQTEILLFFILIGCVALAGGLNDSVFSNYYKEVYHVTSGQRGFIEVPREFPGVVCSIIIALLSSLGDLRMALIAQILSCLGIMVLGFWTPSFSTMLVFLFINSLGVHLFLPIQDSIGMSLAEPSQVGKRMGQYASLRSAVGVAASALVFLGFRLGVFSFASPIAVFLISACVFALAAVVAILLVKRRGAAPGERKKLRFIFRKQYKYFYLLTVFNGVKKQIAFVYGSWVIVDILLKGTDVMALLAIATSFISIFFTQYFGRWLDRFGAKKMMYAEALIFIPLYLVYGLVVWGVDQSFLPMAGWPVVILYLFYVLDRMSMNMSIVRSIYLRTIALEVEEVTPALSTGVSLDHIIAMIAASICGLVWEVFGSQWVFFIAAFFSVGNLIVAHLVQPEKERAYAEEYRRQKQEAISGD
jgi:MFS family permease